MSRTTLLCLFAASIGAAPFLGGWFAVKVLIPAAAAPMPLLPGEFTLPTKDKVTTVEIDGCEYLLLPGPRLVHKGNCHSTVHLRGGALLEDWNGR